MASPFDPPASPSQGGPQDQKQGTIPPQPPVLTTVPPSTSWLDELNQRFQNQPESQTAVTQPEPQPEPPPQPAQPLPTTEALQPTAPEPQPEAELQPKPQFPATEESQQEPSLAVIPPPPPPPTAEEQLGKTSPPSKKGVLGNILRVVIAIVFIALLGFGGTRLFASIQEKRAPKTVTLIYWGLWEDKNIMAPIISDFEREHPNIKIDYQKRDIKQYRETLKTRMSAGSGPDIFRFHNSWLPMLKDDLLPLPKSVTGDSPDKNFYPVIVRDLNISGAYYGLPLEIDTLVLFVNTALLKDAKVEAPKTWNELKNMAPTLTVKDSEGKIKTSGVALGEFGNISHAEDLISLMFAQNGVNLKNIKGNVENLQDALVFYISFAQGEGRVWDSSQDSSILAFSKGKLAMFFGYSWDVFIIQALAPDMHFKIHPVPQLDETNKVAIASYWAEGVSKKSKNQKAAFEFLAYLGKKETLQKFYSEASKTRLFGEPFARVDMADKLESSPYLNPVLEQAKYAVSTPFSGDTFDNGLNKESSEYLRQAVLAILENTSPQTAVETLTRGVDQVFAKYGVR